MAFREKIRDRALPHIPPDQTYRISFMAEMPLWGINGLLPRYRVVVVTDKRVHLFTARLWASCDPGELLGSWAPSALVYRGKILFSHEIYLGNQQLWVRFAFRDLLWEALAACHPADPTYQPASW
ncbi:MAG: hypothetical protein R2729_01140 [Bryobacteraceae bacterium]